MPGLDNLSVSLTKNGYFKVAKVIEKFPADQVLANLDGQVEGVNLAASQIENMLSADGNHKLPEVWDEVRQLESNSIKALVFISIIYSHRELITGLANAKTAEMQGIIQRDVLGDKTYTNLVYSMNSMGLCALKAGASETPYNLSPIFRDFKIGPLAKKIIHLKLIKTGWTEPGADDIFYRTFYEQCEAYGLHNTLAISPSQFHDWLEGNAVEYEHPPVAALSNKSVTVSSSLVAALAAKPLVIMSGPTGTGKTMTARQLAASLTPDGLKPSFNHVFIPVEAGWTDGRHLLGYKNPFGKTGETYSATPLIQLLLKANYKDFSGIPFFIILDEMNLSHVEMYFSRFLSLMETSASKPESLLGTHELELLHAASMSDPVLATYTKAALEKDGLFLTPNVFIIGTVNIDETTHMFSPKVLDRSFVIECPTVLPSQVGKSFSLPLSDSLQIDTLKLADFLLSARHFEKITELDAKLDEIYIALGRYRFGPRVTSECRAYTSACKVIQTFGQIPSKFDDSDEILDRLGMQKLLPKLHGNKAQVLTILEALSAYFVKNKMPNSAQKVDSMATTLKSIGFTNFFA